MLFLKLFCLIFFVKHIHCSSTVYTQDDMDETDDDFVEEIDYEPSKPQIVMDEVPSVFDTFKNKLSKNAELIFKEIANDTKKYKNMRDSAINDNRIKLENNKRSILKNLDNLQEKIIKIENIISKFPKSKHGKLSFAYSQLVDVYKEEQQELKKKINLESMNKKESISDIYAKNIESIFTRVKNNVESLIKDAYNFIVLSKSYEWITFNKQIENIPENAILGGLDIDKTPLYVIRGFVDGSFKYGKYAFNTSRKNAYLANETNEFEKMDAFEVSLK